jgi:hypothetical protein
LKIRKKCFVINSAIARSLFEPALYMEDTIELVDNDMPALVDHKEDMLLRASDPEVLAFKVKLAERIVALNDDLDGGVPLSKDDQERSDKAVEEYIKEKHRREAEELLGSEKLDDKAKKRGREFDEQLKTKSKAEKLDPCIHKGCERARKMCVECTDRFVGLFCEEHTGGSWAKCGRCATVLHDCSSCGEACEEDFITTFEKVKPFEMTIDGAMQSVNKVEVSFRLCDDCISS